MEQSSKAYGRACSACATAKCRCIWRADGAVCERCARLKKSCVPAPSARKKNSQKETLSRIASIEHKLDDIVSLLHSNAQTATASASQDTLSASTSEHGKAPIKRSQPDIPSSVGPSADHEIPFTPGIVPSLANISPERAEQCFSTFKSHYILFFPFLYFAPGTSAQQLRKTRPFLFTNIIAVTLWDSRRNPTTHTEIKSALAREMLLEKDGKGTLDLLLGLLTFIAWQVGRLFPKAGVGTNQLVSRSHDQLLTHNLPSLSRFIQFAMAIAFELRLNKPTRSQTDLMPNIGLSGSFSCRKQTSLEERRALLGCWVASTVISAYYDQIDPMQWTPFMTESLELLSRTRESALDESFTCQIRLHLLTQNIQQGISQYGAREAPERSGLSPASYLAALRAGVSEVRSLMSPGIQPDTMILAVQYYAEMSIFELAISDKPTALNDPGYQKMECLHACFNAARLSMETLAGMPASAWVGLSFPFFALFSRAIVVLYKLSTLKHPGWDTNAVRTSADLLQILDRIIGVHDYWASFNEDFPEPCMMALSGLVFKSIREWCAEKLAQAPGEIPFQNIGVISGPSFPTFSSGVEDAAMREMMSTWHNFVGY